MCTSANGKNALFKCQSKKKIPYDMHIYNFPPLLTPQDFSRKTFRTSNKGTKFEIQMCSQDFVTGRRTEATKGSSKSTPSKKGYTISLKNVSFLDANISLPFRQSGNITYKTLVYF
jgi:hypothetical protein